MYRESGACARGECARGADFGAGIWWRRPRQVRVAAASHLRTAVPPHARVEVAVVPAVRVQERAALRSLQGEPRLEGDPAGRHVADGVLEFEAVEADLVERPAGQRGDGARGDTGARAAGRTQYATSASPSCRDRDRSPVRPTTSPVSAVARAQLALCSPSQASLHSSIQPRASSSDSATRACQCWIVGSRNAAYTAGTSSSRQGLRTRPPSASMVG